MSIVAAISMYCLEQCRTEKRCITCVFSDFVPRVADHLGNQKGKVIRITEWKMEKEERMQSRNLSGNFPR